MSIPGQLDKLWESLQQQRDELRVQMTLARMEARDEWKQAEEKLEQFTAKFADLTAETRDASEDVWNSLKRVGEEVEQAFDRIRRRL
jgi:DNA anti-recombination protein RmuC